MTLSQHTLARKLCNKYGIWHIMIIQWLRFRARRTQNHGTLDDNNVTLLCSQQNGIRQTANDYHQVKIMIIVYCFLVAERDVRCAMVWSDTLQMMNQRKTIHACAH